MTGSKSMAAPVLYELRRNVDHAVVTTLVVIPGTRPEWSDGEYPLAGWPAGYFWRVVAAGREVARRAAGWGVPVMEQHADGWITR